MQAQQAQKPENDEYSKTDEKTSQDKEQQIKANVAKAEGAWKPLFESCFKDFIETTKANAQASKEDQQA